VAPLAEIGVDVEFQARQNDLDGLAAHYFAPSERDAMRVLPEAERRRRFFDYWTLKEAYIKARGKGLALPLDAFWFDLDGAEPAIACDSRIADEPARWRFETIALSPSHLCSVALPAGPGRRPALRVVGA
jgi:4'-phosphopantetheinyl transferase